ncbi:MAG: HD domain-containing protein [Oscillospiraceae bacterium]|nr:HD domain-containing protein [Oscillospiraceae bacterium]
MAYYAHKRELPDGTLEQQSVLAHLYGTAEQAKKCLGSCGLSEAAYLAGLLHDMGKCTADFQTYLDAGDYAGRGTVIHTFQGCRYLLERFHMSENLAHTKAAQYGGVRMFIASPFGKKRGSIIKPY